MKTLIATLGFDEKFCYRAMLRHQIGDGDRVVLLTAGVVDRVRKAYEWIKSFAAAHGDISVELIEINVRNFAEGVKDVLRVLKDLEGDQLIVNISGGMRVLSLIVYVAITLKKIAAHVEIELEDFSGIVIVPEYMLLAPLIFAEISEEKANILKLIAECGEADTKSLAAVLKRDATTVRRHLNDLERLGLVEVISRKPLKVRVTDAGRMMVIS